MKLTDYTDYSLRTLMYVALRDDQLVTIQEISDAFDIPRNHLVKIVHALGKAGYLATVRGRRGGMRLGRAASKIVVGDVVRSMEPDFHMVECFDTGHNQCVITAACGLRGALTAALKAYLDVLDHWTIADLIEKRQTLSRLLQASAPVQFMPMPANDAPRKPAAQNRRER
ncbi:MAG: Rrf2 family transcriptional regulator [Paraburkholderia sp.]|uniref:Rrf2 family transcriptional regulator n=1 Tax=Paraburkholderia sp. TaxID=1926495 RepID=UPI00120767CE|nr:Rrf2 family transcriptional regulator [Paraburkholderia sp.]TAL92751.1 MAG: Rrf2 family transcriptional regulator [Paraburkholderia sp.]